jgi:hypothetical protein
MTAPQRYVVRVGESTMFRVPRPTYDVVDTATNQLVDRYFSQSGAETRARLENEKGQRFS